jgi:hypothetical protein
MRNQRDPLLDVFDLPLFFSSTAARDTTTSPVQSLLLLNSQMMLNHAAKLATFVTASEPSPSVEVVETGAGRKSTLDRLWMAVCGRLPTEAERDEASEFLTAQGQRIREEADAPDPALVPVANLPFRDGQALLIHGGAEGANPTRMQVDVADQAPEGAFTVEACFQLRSIYDSGAVRTLAARWDGRPDSDGWAFGITGKGSRRKPQTLVLQLFGRNRDGQQVEAALFSDHNVSLNVPWFASVSVTPATAEQRGRAVFTLKNLSNDDEPLSVVSVEHDIVGEFRNVQQPVTLGFRSGTEGSVFDGLLDDVRWSRAALSPEELLIQRDGITATTRGYWRFEPVPGLLQDSAQTHSPLQLQRTSATAVSPDEAAFADLCHTLLNCSEFLYVQ